MPPSPQDPEPQFFVGVDAGATHCRARLRDARGATLAEAEAGPANAYVDFAAAVAAMRASVGQVLAEANARDAEMGRIALGLGVAGLTGPADEARLVAAFPGYARVRAVNDAVAACAGAHEGADGGLVIAGTGSAAIASVGGRQTIVGGRGFLLGDDGSGARIGADALRATMRAVDGIGPASPMTAALIADFNGDPNAMTHWAPNAKSGDYGAFAPKVFSFAAEGDPVARPIVETAARAIGALGRRVEALGARRVALVGGISEALRPYFEPAISALLAPPRRDPADGAILLVGGAATDFGKASP